MINKSNLWFLTLSGIILVLAIYYIGGPIETTDMVFSASTNNSDEITITEESESLTAMRVTKEEEDLEAMKTLQDVLLNASTSIDEKNDAYEEIMTLNNTKSIEEKLEKLINESYSVSSFIDITDNKIKVIIANKKSSYELANKIISTINKELKEDFYVTVKFE